MPFEKGHNHSTGRPKGITNKVSKEIREVSAMLLKTNNPKQAITESFDKLVWYKNYIFFRGRVIVAFKQFCDTTPDCLKIAKSKVMD